MPTSDASFFAYFLTFLLLQITDPLLCLLDRGIKRRQSILPVCFFISSIGFGCSFAFSLIGFCSCFAFSFSGFRLPLEFYLVGFVLLDLGKPFATLGDESLVRRLAAHCRLKIQRLKIEAVFDRVAVSPFAICIA